MHNLSLLSDAQSRSISPENFTGEPGQGGRATEGTGAGRGMKLGVGWKISPSVEIAPGTTFTLADIEGPGTIQQIWMTPTGDWRSSILRMYWDDCQFPSVECPVGDFFCSGWGKFDPLSSLAVCVNPGSAFNCYWEMPFRKHCRITMENTQPDTMVLYYQVNYALDVVPESCAYFHAQFRRENPVAYLEPYILLDNVQGQGHYVGTYMAWAVETPNWWGEGEIKFYLDTDEEFPTLCGTGAEDYFCGSYDFVNRETGQTQAFTTPYAGLHQILMPRGPDQPHRRFGMYRWHITDPVRFKERLRVTIQDLGWVDKTAYEVRQDDLASVAYWYQTLPHQPFPPLPGAEALRVD